LSVGKSEEKIIEEGEEARISIVALRDIKKGEEITINYLDCDKLNVTERRKLLKQKYLFECMCDYCLNELQQLKTITTTTSTSTLSSLLVDNLTPNK
jgi:SET domain-containing protein